MPTPIRPESYVYLNALVALKNTLQLRTAVLSPTTLRSVLRESPAAITFSGPGVLDVERLLGGFLQELDLFKPIFEGEAERRYWRCYSLLANQNDLKVPERLAHEELLEKVDAVFNCVDSTAVRSRVFALVPEMKWTAQHEREIRNALLDVVFRTAAGQEIHIEAKSATSADSEASDRQTLVRLRKQMLDKVGSYTSEDLAAAAASTTVNSSQFAADQRKAGKLFGVRFGQAWHYPKFQFDTKRNTIPQMKEVLAALSPDVQGWDRLQWFLEPHEKLKRRTPLEVWKTDRKKVVAAANTERWNGRD